jgi:hypothetical protein
MQIVNTRQSFLQRLSSEIPPNSTCAELGVHRGDFTGLIISTLNPGKLFLIDPWEIGDDANAGGQTYDAVLGFMKTAYSTSDDYSAVSSLFKSHIESGRVSLIRDYSYNAAGLFSDSSLDLVYIDASHIYESVKADLNDYLPKLKSTGLMCGHDYFTYSNFGVMQAVDEFLEENPDFEFFLFNDSPGGYDWALRRNSK